MFFTVNMLAFLTRTYVHYGLMDILTNFIIMYSLIYSILKICIILNNMLWQIPSVKS